MNSLSLLRHHKYAIPIFLLIMLASCAISFRELETTVYIKPLLKNGEIASAYAFISNKENDIPLAVQFPSNVSTVDSVKKADLTIKFTLQNSFKKTMIYERDNQLNPTGLQFAKFVNNPHIPIPSTTESKSVCVTPVIIDIFRNYGHMATTQLPIYSNCFTIEKDNCNEIITLEKLKTDINTIVNIPSLFESLFVSNKEDLKFKIIEKFNCSSLFGLAYEKLKCNKIIDALYIYNQIQDDKCMFYKLYSIAICNFLLKKYGECNTLLRQAIKYPQDDFYIREIEEIIKISETLQSRVP